MMTGVKRIFVEKRQEFALEAQGLLRDLKQNLGILGLEKVRIIHRYDIEGLSETDYQLARWTIFAEPPLDQIYDETLPDPGKARILAMEYLPGQFDQRADSAAQCIQILTRGERPETRTAKLIILEGSITDAEFQRIKTYCINPVESREATLAKPASLTQEIRVPDNVTSITGFIRMNRLELEGLHRQMNLAMSIDDLAFCQEYFRDTEGREPTIAEIRVIDTYWSDHCRHTTFLTRLESVAFEPGDFSGLMEQAYREYRHSRELIYHGREKAESLMDLATIAMKELKLNGKLDDLDESDEINACSILVTALVDGVPEEWLVMFKNETHNHPTEIEPFGGAATCLGGAIRDPLSGRAYVYQAMRVTGSADPRKPVTETLQGKLPQRKITNGAAAGFSSYGNQIGLATGQVTEVYDQGYLAKRMEIGAVIGAVPRANVRRETPQPGDTVILLGGRTGRDGCGGATGSSKAHDEESLLTCGAEVQKGNPPTERKLQRLFRNPVVSRMIKRCNDFGAGGVAVAISELADGLRVDLDAVPKKYEGLDGTELAISESQERMAVVVAPGDCAGFIDAAREENLEATPVATVTAEPRLRMIWREAAIIDISRAFLNTNGVPQTIRVEVASPNGKREFFRSLPQDIADAPHPEEAWLRNLERLAVCSQKGLAERFDSTIGAGTVLMPFGGSRQLTPAEGMAAKLPIQRGDTTTGTLMTFGYNPVIAKWSPFHGAVYAIIEAVAKIAAVGGDYRQIRLTLQEYFEKPGDDPKRWGKPFAALLGAYYAQMRLGIPAIGGKDSMSGSFNDLDVPPTLVAFALAVADVRRVLSPEFKLAGSQVVLLPLKRDGAELPDFEQLGRNCSRVYQLIGSGKIRSAISVKTGGLAEALTKMAIGNMIGCKLIVQPEMNQWFAPDYGSLVLEIPPEVAIDQAFEGLDYRLLGVTVAEPRITAGGLRIDLETARSRWEAPLEPVFPMDIAALTDMKPPRSHNYQPQYSVKPHRNLARPRIVIPVFPGTNCEYDSARAFEKAGGLPELLIFRNLSPREIEASVELLVRKINNAQIIMLPGGFSGGDEPDGSGKFIATVFRNPYVKEAVTRFLEERDGLMLGICNGFQALIKLGLVPFGSIRDITEDSPTLTYNTIGRHVSCLVRTRVASKLSPWLGKTQLGEIHSIAVSHGEGRFVASPALLEQLAKSGQIATQYVDEAGNPSYDRRYNPNGSFEAIEGITSPDGRIFGKMGHSERYGPGVAVNIPGSKDQPIFRAGVEYFK